MNRRSLTKIVLLPVAVMPLFIFGCKANSVKAEIITYRDVLIKDFVSQLIYGGYRLEDIDPIEIVPYFMNDYGSVYFYTASDYRPHLCFGLDSFPAVFDDELILYFKDQTHIPFVWHDHSIYDFSNPVGVPDNLRIHEDGIRIQEIYDTKTFDFSILDLPFVEKE